MMLDLAVPCTPETTDQAYLSELKEFVALHLRSQAADYEPVLARISGEHSGPGGWTHEWVERGRQFEQAGKVIEAIQCYNFARFPFADTAEKKSAHRRCVRQFADWVGSQDARVARVSIPVGDRRVPVYTLGTDSNRPLLLVLGGIVSLKEQWHKLLFGAHRLGFSPVVMDFPGVGENHLTFNQSSAAFLRSVLDYFGIAAQRTYVVGLSFGGYLAMKAAVADDRIKGITTVGAPVSHFYTDETWWERVPAITKRALSHVCKVRQSALFATLHRFALTADELQQLRIPVHYLLSLRDEIIPVQEKEMLERHVRELSMTVVDDVHGAANHMDVLQKYIPWSIIQQRSGAAAPLALILRAALTATILKRRFVA